MKFSLRCFIFVASVLCLTIDSIKGADDKKKAEVKDIETEEFIKYLGCFDALIIDVRNPKEIRKAGTFFAAINIEEKDVEKTLGTMSPSEFFCRYGHLKPKKSTPVVFFCKTGRESAAAAKKAVELGYTNVFNYKGGWTGWLEYVEKHKPKCCYIPQPHCWHDHFVC